MAAARTRRFGRALRLTRWSILEVVGGLTLGLQGLPPKDFAVELFGQHPAASTCMIVVGSTMLAIGLIGNRQRVETVKEVQQKANQDCATRDTKITNLKERVDDLETQKARLEQELTDSQGALFQLAEQTMIILVGQLRLSARARASVYLAEDDGFRLAGRYSGDESLCRPGREKYPMSGCMGRAWQQGSAVVPNLPAPDIDRRAYVAAQRRHGGLDADTVRALTMASRSYIGVRIPHPEGDHPLGVVVVESLDPDRLDLARLQRVLEQGLQRTLSHLLRRMVGVVPNADIARAQGF